MAKSETKEWLRGSLDLVVLSTLADGPQYGYLIQKKLKEGVDEGVKVSAGTLYPILHKLESDQLIRSRWDEEARPRKWYELTALGRTRLTEQARSWTQSADFIRRLLAPVLDAAAPRPREAQS